MAGQTKNIKILSRVDSALNWQTYDPVLEDKEIAYERETGQYKIGDGETKWSNLPYIVCKNIVDGEGKGALKQKVEGSTSDTIAHTFKNANYGLGNSGGTWFTQPTEIATLENCGWEFNSTSTSAVVSNHGGTGLDNNFGIRTVYSYADPATQYTKNGKPVFSINVNVEKEGKYIFYVNATSFDLDTFRNPVIGVYINDILLEENTIDTSKITELNTPTFFNVGEAKFVAGVNKIEFVCLTELTKDGSTPYFNIDSITLRGKESKVTGKYSSAFGRYHKVAGEHAVALNYDNTITNNYSLAGGCANIVEGHTSAAFGGSNQILGEANGNSFVSGHTNIIDGSQSFIGGGKNNSITGNYNSIVGGYENTLNGTNNFIAGSNNEIKNGNKDSFILGNSNTINENTNTDLGSGNFIAGIGNNLIAGTSSFMTGQNNKLTGSNAFVNGAHNTVSGNYADGGGWYCRAIEQGAFARGGNTTASGTYSVALNDRTTASGEDATALGQEALSSGWASLAAGYKTQATHDYSQAFGANTQTSAIFQNVVGYNNANNTNAIFIVGNGGNDSEAGRHNAFTVNKDNSITLGNTPVTESELIFTKQIGNQISTRQINLGQRNTITSDSPYNYFAYGYDNTLSGRGTVAFGWNNIDDGDNNFTFGSGHQILNNSNNAHASEMFVVGNGNKTVGELRNGIMIGHGLRLSNNNSHSIVTGRYNSYSNSLIFAVGAGTSDEDRKNAIEVNENGTVLINGEEAITRSEVEEMIQEAINNAIAASY